MISSKSRHRHSRGDCSTGIVTMVARCRSDFKSFATILYVRDVAGSCTIASTIRIRPCPERVDRGNVVTPTYFKVFVIQSGSTFEHNFAVRPPTLPSCPASIQPCYPVIIIIIVAQAYFQYVNGGLKNVFELTIETRKSKSKLNDHMNCSPSSLQNE